MGKGRDRKTREVREGKRGSKRGGGEGQRRGGWELERGGIGRKRREKEKDGRKGGKPQNAENCNFYQIFYFGGSCAHPTQSGPNLALNCGPLLYASMPNFIMIGIYYYYITTDNLVNINFGGSCTHTRKSIWDAR